MAEDLLEALRKSLQRGLADSTAGRTRDLGDFTQYASLPFHYRDNGKGCEFSGTVQPDNLCPNGCSNEDHYSNDGHAECVDNPLAIT